MKPLAGLVAAVVLGGCASADWARVVDDAGSEASREWAAGVDRAARRAREIHMELAPAEPFVLRRREVEVGTRWGKEGVWLDRASTLFAPRVDPATLSPAAKVTVWTLGDDVIAAALPDGLMALPAAHNGVIRFFDESGRSLDGRFVARPVAFAFVASRFGRRIDPFTGKSAFHTGVDLAADDGAPVVSVGDGVVVDAAENPVAGRFVTVRHPNGLLTKYLHLRAFAPHMRPSKRVKAGEVVGFVGSTGMSTGPHLHFEVVKDGVAIDPSRVRWPRAQRLTRASIPAHLQLAEQLRAMTPADVVTVWPPT